MLEYRFIFLILVFLALFAKGGEVGYVLVQSCDDLTGQTDNTTGIYYMCNYCYNGYTFDCIGRIIQLFGPTSGSSSGDITNSGLSDSSLCDNSGYLNSWLTGQCVSGFVRTYFEQPENPINSYIEDTFDDKCTDSSEDNSSGESNLIYRFYAQNGKCIYNSDYTIYNCFTNNNTIQIDYYYDSSCTTPTSTIGLDFSKSCSTNTTILMYCS
ncbi:hypothetical protein DLAC_04309 [Tieghemostelium lacteum]|uniref:Uncharacterized protein n=1 Tax=Tieghemostelium lacteum TaxID=361077 RepID=A0A151ZJE6_TIELA|nr:hypothetical protein DLAC_04309 [Tieghemostelium lacteum]|eukprot:KYQ94035.1 hypothetical protein DLAC_04309 [Tieghemostelium lacteum]